MNSADYELACRECDAAIHVGIQAEADTKLVANGELAPSRAFKASLPVPTLEQATEVMRSFEKDLANAAYHGSASVLSAIQKPANPLYDQDKSPVYPGLFAEVSPAIENADAVWEVRAVNYTMGTATLRQPRGQSWRLADVALGRLAIVPKKPETWNALAGLADWERTLAAIMANPPVTVLEMGQKKGVAWQRFLVGLADVREVLEMSAKEAASGLPGGETVAWTVAHVLSCVVMRAYLREDGWEGVGYPGQQQRDFTPRAMR